MILRGSGDPRLTLENFWLMLRNLRARGLREIRGDLVLDRSYFAGCEAADPGGFDNEPTRPYNTPPDALLVNFKSFRLSFLPDAERRTVRIAVEPPLPQLQIVNNLVLDGEPCGDWVARLKLAAAGDAASARLVFSGNFALACGEKERHFSVLGPRAIRACACLRCCGANSAAASAAACATAASPAGATPLLTLHVAARCPTSCATSTSSAIT